MRYFVSSFLLVLFAACGGGAGSGGGTGGDVGTSTTITLTTITSTTTTGTSTTTGFGGGSTTGSGSSSSGGGMDGGATSSSTGAGGGAMSAHGDCASDGDCPGGACVELTPGGFRVCQTPPEKATICGSAFDQCCAGMPCPNNEPCYTGPLVPYCAGIPMEPYNQCAVDQCAQDADCASGQICGVAGTLGQLIRACVPAGCKTDADCAAAPGGICAPITEPCCNTFAGLYCVYPDVGCRSNADCDPSSFCQITGSSATCQPGGPVCPA